MLNTILIILGIAIVLILLMKKTRQQIYGICAVALEQTVHKSKNKGKILELLERHCEIANHEIRGALGVSERTVVRYLDELEREGKVEQIGPTGRSVIYRRK